MTVKKLGLIDGVHYIACNCCNNKKFIETAKYIFDPINRRKIDGIRLFGQRFAKKNLNGKKKYHELKDIFEKL